MTSVEDEEEELFPNLMALVFALVTLVVYFLFLKPTAAPSPPPTRTAGATTARRRRTPTNNNNNNNNAGPPSWNQPDRPRPTQHYMSEAAMEVLENCRTRPPHVSTVVDRVGFGGASVLVDGLVSFSHTPASSLSSASSPASSSSSPTGSSLRPERAKILSRLVATLPGDTMVPPPAKGSTVVVSLSQSHLLEEQDQVSRCLLVLGTWYNMIVLVEVKDDKVEKDTLVKPLRKGVSEQALPTHRILLCQSVTGRVALVRQLARVALVVDWEEEVSKQLERFGYKVALVPQGLGTLLDKSA